MNSIFIYTLSNTFRSLKHRNFRLFFFGQCISVIGTWIQQIAISWLIYRLTNSAFIMGFITFIGAIPAIFVTPFAGVIIDRINKHKALILIQLTFLLEAAALAFFTISNSVNVPIILIIGLFNGISAAIDMPLRQALIIQLIDKNEDLSNAISLNSSSFNLARLVGPAIAGVLIASVGEGLCFLINAISYIAVIWALALIHVDYSPIKFKQRESFLTELKEGFSYTYNFKSILYVTLFIAIAGSFGMAFPVIMPIFAKEILGGNAQTLGYLMSGLGIGALGGALYLSARCEVRGLSNRIIIATIALGFALIGLNFTKNLYVAISLLTIVGIGMVMIIAGCNTLIQYFVDEDKRGRIMSIYTMAFFGTVPFGSLIEGSVAEKLGVPFTFLLDGIAMLTLAIWLFSKSKILKKDYKLSR